LKVVALVPPMVWLAALNVTVLVLGISVPPLLVQLPLTPKVFAPLIVKVAPLPSEMFLQTAAALIVGWLGTPVEMKTSIAAVGMVLLHQLVVVFQLVLVAPVQIPLAQAPTFTTPVVAVK